MAITPREICLGYHKARTAIMADLEARIDERLARDWKRGSSVTTIDYRDVRDLISTELWDSTFATLMVRRYGEMGWIANTEPGGSSVVTPRPVILNILQPFRKQPP